MKTSQIRTPFKTTKKPGGTDNDSTSTKLNSYTIYKQVNKTKREREREEEEIHNDSTFNKPNSYTNNIEQDNRKDRRSSTQWRNSQFLAYSNFLDE